MVQIPKHKNAWEFKGGKITPYYIEGQNYLLQNR
jgi:hypothetical protein